jgi:hypothetical protein
LTLARKKRAKKYVKKMEITSVGIKVNSNNSTPEKTSKKRMIKHNTKNS